MKVLLSLIVVWIVMLESAVEILLHWSHRLSTYCTLLGIQVVELPMLHPEKFVKLGIDPPKGVLCYGPPGTGKTLLARAVANRTDACFIRVIGSELVQKYVGEGARMVRELFQVFYNPCQ